MLRAACVSRTAGRWLMGPISVEAWSHFTEGRASPAKRAVWEAAEAGSSDGFLKPTEAVVLAMVGKGHCAANTSLAF